MLFLLAAPAALVAPAPVAPPFSGTYRAMSDEGPVALTLTTGAAGALTGTMVQGGNRIALSGRVNGEDQATLTGTVGGASVRVVLRRDGDRLQARLLDPDGAVAEELVFTPDAPSATTKPAAPKPAPKAARPAVPSVSRGRGAPPAGRAADEKTYRHPLGASFRYPSAWTLQEAAAALVLVPPAFRQGEELYLATTLSADGVTGVDDPRVAQAVDAVAAQQGLSRTDSQTLALEGGKGLILSYAGTLLGKPARGRAYLTIQNGYCLSFVALATPERLGQREGAVRRMFASLALGEGKRDPALVGSWVGELVDNGRLMRGADGKISSNVSGNSQSRYVLSADGTVIRTTWSQTIISTSTRVGDTTSGGIADSGEQVTTTRGTWRADGGRFSALWDNGPFLAGTYQASPGRVVLRFGNTTLTLSRG